MMSAAKAKELGLKPLARVKAYASAGVEPSIMHALAIYKMK